MVKYCGDHRIVKVYVLQYILEERNLNLDYIDEKISSLYLLLIGQVNKTNFQV